MMATDGTWPRVTGKCSADLQVGTPPRAEPSTCSGRSLIVTVNAPWRRWLAFYFVGGLGIAVQLATLAAFTAWAGLHYLLATGLAVEVAVLHNFVWHERWTWSDRASQDKPGRWKRLLRFQITNGALSLGGNLVLMKGLVSMCAMNYTLANIFSITLCSILNFLASDRLVFQSSCAVLIDPSHKIHYEDNE